MKLKMINLTIFTLFILTNCTDPEIVKGQESNTPFISILPPSFSGSNFQNFIDLKTGTCEVKVFANTSTVVNRKINFTVTQKGGSDLPLPFIDYGDVGNQVFGFFSLDPTTFSGDQTVNVTGTIKVTVGTEETYVYDYIIDRSAILPITIASIINIDSSKPVSPLLVIDTSELFEHTNTPILAGTAPRR